LDFCGLLSMGRILFVITSIYELFDFILLTYLASRASELLLFHEQIVDQTVILNCIARICELRLFIIVKGE
jgi:hypothetical protein